ncbi:MAG TPA: glycosyltransferase, partial [Mycobacterium sp.]|nr:glycosyltransferase [Mycobacterium sp.]
MTVTRETASPTETRVLMVLDSFNFGGAENLVAELGRFAPAGLALSVASLAPQSDGRTAMLDRLTAAGLHPRFLSVRRLLDPAGFVRLVRTLRHAQADVIHAHLGYCAILVTLAARLAGKPVVTTLHVSPQDDARFGEFIKERLAVRIPSRLGRLVLVSHHLYHRYAERHGPARDTWRVIPNAIDVERYTPARGSAGTDRPVWAVVAALRPKKNHLDLIRAWTEVAAVHPDA